MKLQKRINLFIRLSKYFLEDNDAWKLIKKSAGMQNPWFTQEFVELAIQNILS